MVAATNVNLGKRFWYIHGQAYDLTAFMPHHPGGSEALKIGQGINCTELFETYHFKNRPPKELMEKYRVKDVEAYSDVERQELLEEKYKWEQTGFYNVIKQRVRQHFEKTKDNHKGADFYRYLVFIQMLAIVLLKYPAFILGNAYVAVIYGCLKGVTAVGTGHALSHFALFNIDVNYNLFRFGSPFVLSSAAVWSTSHVVSHHIHTLTPADLQDNYPLKRIQPALPHLFFHKYQHYYVWLVYLIGLPLWTMVDFFATFPVLFTGRHEMRTFDLKLRLENVIVFSLNLLLTVFLPFFFLEFYHALTVCLAANIPASLIVVLQITVNHEVPETMAKLPNEMIDWGVHQVLTSHNFSCESVFWLHCSGGLNMQVEHHLFPGVHYSHYHEIAKIVKAACKEFGLPYNTSSTLFEALQKHYQILETNSTK